MSDKKILPLFEWQPEVKIIPFPANRRIGKARMVAREIYRRVSDETRGDFWNASISNMTRQMEKVGIDSAIIEREISAFAALVQKEIDRIGTSFTSGDAA